MERFSPAAAPTPTLPRKRGREKAPHLAKSISSLTGAMWIALDSLRSIAPSPACGGGSGWGATAAAVCPGVRRDDGRDERDITMTTATKIPVAKSCPRASNRHNQKSSGGFTRVHSQTDGKRQGGFGRGRGPHSSRASVTRSSQPDR